MTQERTPRTRTVTRGGLAEAIPTVFVDLATDAARHSLADAIFAALPVEAEPDCPFCDGTGQILMNGLLLTPQEGGPEPDYRQCTACGGAGAATGELDPDLAVLAAQQAALLERYGKEPDDAWKVRVGIRFRAEYARLTSKQGQPDPDARTNERQMIDGDRLPVPPFQPDPEPPEESRA